MKYKNIVKGLFIKRPNRFLAHVLIDGVEEICHVKNTGRLGELLIPNAIVYLETHDDPKRKTKFSLIAVEKDGVLYNIDSQAPNKLAYEWIKEGNLIDGLSLIKAEKTYGNSRFDLYMEAGERKIFMEVKGVTLNKDGIGLFPDAPTERGKKHVEELMNALADGYEAYVLFVVKFQPVKGFRPNYLRQPEFLESLKKAKETGVNIIAVCCNVMPDRITISHQIPVELCCS